MIEVIGFFAAALGVFWILSVSVPPYRTRERPFRPPARRVLTEMQGDPNDLWHGDDNKVYRLEHIKTVNFRDWAERVRETATSGGGKGET